MKTYDIIEPKDIVIIRRTSSHYEKYGGIKYLVERRLDSGDHVVRALEGHSEDTLHYFQDSHLIIYVKYVRPIDRIEKNLDKLWERLMKLKET